MDACAAEPTRTGTQPAQPGSGSVSTCLLCKEPLTDKRIEFLHGRSVPHTEWECRPCHKKGKDKNAKRVSLRPPPADDTSPLHACPKCKGVMVWSDQGLPDLYWECDGCGYDAGEDEWRWRCHPCPFDLCSTCLPRPVVAGSVTLASATPPLPPLAPDKPPGEDWKAFIDDDLKWWYYDGPLGKWWYSEQTGVEPYTQEDRETLKRNIRGSLFAAIEKLQPGRAAKITEKLLELELDNTVLSKMLHSEALLKEKIDEYLSAPLRIGANIDGIVTSISADTACIDVCSFADARLNLQQGFAPSIGDRIEGMLIEEVDQGRQWIIVSLKDPVATSAVETEIPGPAAEVKSEPVADHSTTVNVQGHRGRKRLPRDLSPVVPPPGRPASPPPKSDPNANDRKRTRREPRAADQSHFAKCAQCRNTIGVARTRQLEGESLPKAEWRCVACVEEFPNWAHVLPRETTPSVGNNYGVDGKGNPVSIDGYWSSNEYPLLQWRIAGHVANRAHNQFCLLCPYGIRADRFCYLSDDGNQHIAIGELFVSTDLEPDCIKWDDGEIWHRREGIPSAYIVGDRWSGAPANLPALTSLNTEWIRQPAQSCYNQFVLYKLCSVFCSSSSSNNSSVSSCTPGATPWSTSSAAAEIKPPWRK